MRNWRPYTRFAGAIAEAVEAGTAVGQSQAGYERVMQAHGWSYHGKAGWDWRLMVRLQTQNAYMARRREQVQRVLQADRGRVNISGAM